MSRAVTAINNWLWQCLAQVLSTSAITEWLIARAKRTPYFHLRRTDDTVYMERYWLFNPYPNMLEGKPRKHRAWLPSVRLHWIRDRDRDPHMHDHPWHARTVLLKGWYAERRLEDGEENFYWRKAGQSVPVRFNEFHRITDVPLEGVWTMFITWKYQGTWGFLVDGHKVPWKEYLDAEGRPK